MRNVPAIVTATALFALCFPAHACLGGRRLPQLDDLERYSEIRVVEVTGVRLTAYEAYQLMRRGVKPWPKPKGDIEYAYPTSSTPGFAVYTLVDRTIKGAPAAEAVFTLGGCGVNPPKLRDRGIMFVEQGSSYARAVWQTDGDTYRKVAKAVGVELGAEP